jgi:hypothetical protein
VAQKRGEEYVEEDMKVLGLWAEDAQEKLNWQGGSTRGPSDPCKHGVGRR